jgi:hypothetical protein
VKLTNFSKISVLLLCCALGALTACAAEIGSERWCENMQEKAKGDWTFQETADYARHCVFREERE